MIGQLATLAPMQEADIPQVMAIDHQSFPLPWSERSYRRELLENPNAHWVVALDPVPPTPQNWLARLTHPVPERRVIGYAGWWLIVDEVHLNTLAVHPDWRQRGIGEQLLQAVIESAAELCVMVVTLEVRTSNGAAQQLYRKHGFEIAGERKRYYRDNREDALIMTLYLTQSN